MQTLYPILMKFLSNNPEFISNGLKFIWVTPSLYQTQQPKVYMRHPNFVSIGTAQSLYKTPSSLYQTEQPNQVCSKQNSPNCIWDTPKFVSNRTAQSLYETPQVCIKLKSPKFIWDTAKFLSNRTAQSLYETHQVCIKQNSPQFMSSSCVEHVDPHWFDHTIFF